MLFLALSPRKQPHFFCGNCADLICDDDWVVTPIRNGDKLFNCDNCGQHGISVPVPTTQPPDAIGV